MVGRLDRLDREVVHHLQRGGHDAGGDDARGRLGRRLDVGKWREEDQRRLWRRRKPNQRLGDDAEHALGADHGPGEVVAGVPGRAAAGPDDAPVGQDDLETENVIRRHAVLEAMRSAGVLGDIAADGAGFLAGWIGREEEAVAERLFGELEIDHARLDQRGAVFAIDLEDAVHPGQADDDPALLRDRATGETGAGAASDDWQTSLASQEDDLGDLLRVSSAGRRRSARRFRRRHRRCRRTHRRGGRPGARRPRPFRRCFPVEQRVMRGPPEFP